MNLVNSKNKLQALKIVVVACALAMNFFAESVYAVKSERERAVETAKNQKNIDNTVVANKNNNDLNGTISSSDNVSNSETQKRPVGTQLYGTEYHDNLYGKSSVITAGGGGNMGRGGGAAKKNGGTSGSSVDISNSGELKLAPIKSSSDNGKSTDMVDETLGYAEDQGEFYKEFQGDYAGKKVFEFDQMGGIGFDDTHVPISSIGLIMKFGICIILILGAGLFMINAHDIQSKTSYF